MKKTFLNMRYAEQLAGWIWLVIQLFSLPSIVGMANILLHLDLSVAMMNIILFILDFIAIAVIFHRYLLLQLRSIKLSRLLIWVPLGFMLYWALSIATTYLVTFSVMRQRLW